MQEISDFIDYVQFKAGRFQPKTHEKNVAAAIDELTGILDGEPLSSIKDIHAQRISERYGV